MSTRECDRCGETCHGCDNTDDPHLCPSCKEKKDMEKFKGIQAVLDGAQAETERFFHDYVGTEHLLLAFVKHSTSGVLERLKVSRSMICNHIERIVQSGPSMTRRPEKCPLTPRSKRALEFAKEEAEGLVAPCPHRTPFESDSYACSACKMKAVVAPDHLLIGLLREEEGIAATVLRELGVTVEKAREAIKGLIDFGEPCEHVEKFKKELQALYARNNNFVTLDGALDFHCHVCSGVHKIPEELMQKSGKPKEEQKGPGRKQVVVTRLKVVTSVNVPDFSEGSPSISHRAIPLDPSVTLWLVKAEDDVGEWKETYAAEKEKDAFLRGFRAASAMHGDHDPTVVEIQR